MIVSAAVLEELEIPSKAAVVGGFAFSVLLRPLPCRPERQQCSERSVAAVAELTLTAR
jgi:hypothetical protein